MKQRWKAVILSVFALLLVWPFITVHSTATEKENDEYEITELQMTHINPLYQDVVTEKDLKTEKDITWHRGNADGTVYESVESAGTYMRSCMKKRIEDIELDLVTTNSDIKGQTEAIADYAELHTGVPTEGDYIRWQYAGWRSSMGYYFDGTSYHVTVSYVVTYYTTAAQEAKMDTEVAAVLQKLNLSGKSDYGIICAIYDYICKTITYDYVNLNNDSYKLKHTAYAALINKTAVCQGYAVLLYRLMLENNIDCRLISGWGGGPHGWNIVKLKSRYYNLDSTWDAGRNPYDYFLKCNANFSDHQRDEEYCTADFNTRYPMAEEDYTDEPDSPGNEPDEPESNPFKDVSASNYFYKPVLWAVEKGITTGSTANTFNPSGKCTRAQIMTFLWRAYGSPQPAMKVNPFKDVSSNAYYYKAVMWAVENKITSGSTPSTFNPNGECTRSQVVAMMWKAAGSPEPTKTENRFKDVSSSAYYYKAVMWAVEKGITTGKTATAFGSGDVCTRAQVVTFLYNGMK